GAGQAAGGVGQMFLNHFTQNQEREADEVGLRFTYQAGYDPRVAAGMQERLAVEVPQSMSAGYFDTHPSSVERAVAARREAGDLQRRAAGRRPAIFEPRDWLRKMIEQSLDDEKVRTALFRFVDVLPSLRGARDVGSHLEEYFATVDHALGGLTLLAHTLHAG